MIICSAEEDLLQLSADVDVLPPEQVHQRLFSQGAQIFGNDEIINPGPGVGAVKMRPDGVKGGRGKCRVGPQKEEKIPGRGLVTAGILFNTPHSYAALAGYRCVI